MVEVYINNNRMDIIQGSITYVKQVNEFGDLSKQNSSYTWGFKIPKTYRNTKHLRGLGLIGSETKLPYELNTAFIRDNGVSILSNGIAEIGSTEEKTYEINIKEGIIRFQKAIENKNIKDDLNLDIAIKKTAQNIVDFWTEEHPPVKFLVADYMVKKQMEQAGALKSAFFVPFIQLKYIWDKIFEDVGYTYEGDFDGFEDWYLSYPSPTTTGEDTDLTIGEIKFEGQTGPYSLFPEEKYWRDFEVDASDPLGAVGNFGIEVLRAGNITLSIPEITGGTIMKFRDTRSGREKIQFYEVIVVEVNGIRSYVGDNPVGGLELYLGNYSVGEKITINVYPADFRLFSESPFINPYPITEFRGAEFWHKQGMTVQYYWRSTEPFNFGDVFEEFSYKDIIKEVMIRYGHTAFVDAERKHIKFVNSNNRLKIENNIVRDLDPVFSERTKESYTLDGYAQRNYLRSKQSEDFKTDESFFKVDNENLNQSDTFFQSKFASPLEGQYPYLEDFNIDDDMDIIPTWQSEAQEDENGVVEIKYKPREGEYFLVKQQLVKKTIAVDDYLTAKFYIAQSAQVKWRFITDKYYSVIRKTLSEYKMQSMELSLNAFTLSDIELRDVYYSSEEKAFFIFSKIEYRSGKISKAELMKLKP